MGRRLRAVAGVAALGLIAGGALPANAATGSSDRTVVQNPGPGKATSPTVDPRNLEWEKAVDAKFRVNPNDYLGMDAASKSAGGSSLKWSIPAAGLTNVDSATAARAYADFTKSAPPETPLEKISPQAARETADAQMAATGNLPPDAFNVAGYSSWIRATDQFVFVGSWNFRDNFVGSGQPHDVSGLSFRNSCWEDAGTTWSIYDYKGTNYSKTGYLAWGAINKTSIVQMNDQTSGFVKSNDHGQHRQYVKKGGNKQCHVVPEGMFYFNANQGGGSLRSVDITFGRMTVSFERNVLTLQKSTQVFRAP